MKMRNAAAALALAVAMGTIPGAASGVDAVAMPGAAKQYTNCTALKKDYPRGIAATKYRVSKNSDYVYSRVNGKKVKYRPSLINDKAYYKQKNRSDMDDDFVACEQSGW